MGGLPEELANALAQDEARKTAQKTQKEKQGAATVGECPGTNGGWKEVPYQRATEELARAIALLAVRKAEVALEKLEDGPAALEKLTVVVSLLELASDADRLADRIVVERK